LEWEKKTYEKAMKFNPGASGPEAKLEQSVLP
jgi:hypothetical protein